MAVDSYRNEIPTHQHFHRLLVELDMWSWSKYIMGQEIPVPGLKNCHCSLDLNLTVSISFSVFFEIATTPHPTFFWMQLLASSSFSKTQNKSAFHVIFRISSAEFSYFLLKTHLLGCFEKKFCSFLIYNLHGYMRPVIITGSTFP